uniref:sodium/potassium/calcium exchanger 1-like n=1 Tax=Scatophagus argus TaxID=75038 RepID=UPI001ED7E835|nr:sodium/potassium/calcium exchanger 1-like [Scatophagus argus]XP_046251425.1 sodium/potassium/calcium exchanger 1-like [Scatophagus argus]XP_046251433.1 sodium/potassium/calcium exchanger 1-like [Scatophagus argus]XP_046251438.1 sodium/potassium/calcium exchanger 1-like [Scatophagus argus]
MNVHSPPPRRLRRSRVLFFISGVLLCLVYTLTLKARLSQPRASAQTDDALRAEWGHDDAVQVNIREVMASNETEEEGEEVVSPEITKPPLVIIVNRTDIEQCIYVDPKPPPTLPPPTTTATPRSPLPPPHRKGDFPEDLFSVEQRQQGWVVLHVIGMIYMFVALAIVCDEFFVPGLEVITNRLEISDDVAGATFMAAGGSAPELFTSLIGVFISHSNVGIGTIVGSAVFNILFVIGMCAIFSREMLHLTWWPLFRDVTFYILDLIMLIVFFLDNTIMWWESILLVLAYISYVSFMKFNSQIEQAVKTQLNKHMSIVKVWTAEEPEKESEAPAAAPPAAAPPPTAAPKAEDKSKREADPPPSSPQSNKPPSDPQEDRARLRVRPVLQRGGSSASLHNTSLRNTIFQLMIHTLDPLGEDTDHKPNTEQVGTAGGAAAEPSTSQPQKTEETSEKTPGQQGESKEAAEGSEGSEGSGKDESGDEESSDSGESEDDEEENGEEEEENEPLSLEWPETRRKQATYLLLLPIVFPLWLTLPDVRNPASRKYFIMTFLGSILWIGVFSYMMVWWAHQVGETMGISEEIMGLTILAAGTSIPDLITSVIVARKGLGDMAVSSSVGSNIFDITVGLPVPWLLYTLLHKGEPVTVSSNGLFCAIVLLFLMLLFVIISIAACRWKMSRMLGLTMFILYFVFLVLSVLLEDRILICPISI